ncbi:hypothetical protein C8T65DRAFT_700472 [Cerioporus squamosus]|nr:hypothetical protein C8T65DRAFT_700472 [Cerioporus squamosus]
MSLDSRESSPEPHLSPERWIGCGKQWPESATAVQGELSRLYNSRFAPPAKYDIDNLYDVKMSVSKLVSATFRKQSKSITHFKASAYFSRDCANANPDTDDNAPVPASPLLDKLKIASGQAMLDGAQSILHPESPTHRYPLWILTYWLRMCDILTLRASWAGCCSWLSKQTRDPVASTVFETAIQHLETLPCNVPTSALGRVAIHTSDFLQFISDRWLSDEHVNLMVAHINRRLQEAPELAARVEAKDEAFYDASSPRYLNLLETKLGPKPRCVLYFPVYLPEYHHWITIRVNFFRNEISYADSLGQAIPSPKEILERTRWWASKRFTGKFKVIGHKLSIGRQLDGYSCGICAINAMTHDIFGDALWSDEKKALHRVRWFNIVCEEHIKWETSHGKTDVPDEPNSRAGDVPADEGRTELPSGAPTTIPPSSRSSPCPSSPLLRPTSPLSSSCPSSPPGPQSAHVPASASFKVSSEQRSPSTETSNVSRRRLEKPTLESFWRQGGSTRSDSPGARAGAKRKQSDRDVSDDEDGGSSSESDELGRDDGEGTKSSDDEDSDDKDGDDARSSSTHMKVKKNTVVDWASSGRHAAAGAVGVSRSNRHSVALNDLARKGLLTADPVKLARFKKKICDVDDRCEFREPDVGKTVHHLPCNTPIQMKAQYDTSHWKRHKKTCRGHPPLKRPRVDSGKNANLLHMFARSTAASTGSRSKAALPALPPPPAVELVPCPGLSAEKYPSVEQYLCRTGALGGGARSLTVIAAEKYGKPYKLLTHTQKKQVRLIQRHEWRWRNEHGLGKVYALGTCQKNISVHVGEEPLPCAGCDRILHCKAFQNLTRKPIPTDANRQCNNDEYKNLKLVELYGKFSGLSKILECPDPSRSPFIQFALGALDGSFKDEVFIGLIEAIMVKKDKITRGVGMQGFKYAPAFDEFMQLINVHSPKAYRFITKHIPGRTQRSIQHNEALRPRFPIGISQRTFEIAVEYLNMLEYTGPVGLSADDTKLVPGFDPVFDKQRNGFVILGGIGDPLPVANPEELTAAIAAGKIEKAEKLRLWVMSIPLPGASPLILAAMGVGNKTSASFLWENHQRILTGLCDADINVISSAADGATTEHAMQEFLEQTATDKLRYSVAHPAWDTTLVLDIPCFGPQKQPIVPVQDARHALKTLRNTIYTGCRLLTMGPEVVLYSHARRMAEENGPLYMRDVEKVDRQDDNAAARLFSGDALEWLSSHDEESHRGTAVYLFVYGELVDAHIGRTVDLAERLKMCFCAEFFTDLWEVFLRRAGYSKSRHFLSHQAAAIVRRLSRSYVQLLYLFRDHLGGQFPLLPWLLSSEPCEHSFGISRLIIEDFKMLQFYYMIPKITAQIRSKIFTTYHGDAKARASGYHHSYTDSRGVDLAVLRQFPSDCEIASILEVAYEEALSLWALLGVSPSELDPKLSSPSYGLSEETDGVVASAEDDDSDTESLSDWGSEFNDDEVTERLLDDVIAELEHLPMDFVTEDQIMKLTYTAISLAVDDGIRINSLPEPSEEDAEDWLSQAADTIAAVLKDSASKSPDSAPQDQASTAILDSSADMSELVKIRRQHQTLQAAGGVRVRQGKEAASASESDSQSHGSVEVKEARHEVLRKFQGILKDHQPENHGPALKRLSRWTGTGTSAPGNSANAEQAAKTRSSKQLSRRRDIYKQYLPEGFDHLHQGRVTKMTPLTSPPGSNDPALNPEGFAYILLDGQIRLGRVLSVYTRGGGKHGRHGWVYDYAHGRQFCMTSNLRMARCRRKSYALIDPNLVLCKTRHPPKPVRGDLHVTLEDAQDFTQLKAVLATLHAVVKELKKKKKGTKGAQDEQEDEDE